LLPRRLHLDADRRQADLDGGALGEHLRARHAHAVDERAVGRSEVLDLGPAEGVAADTRVPPRYLSVGGQVALPLDAAAEQQVVADRNLGTGRRACSKPQPLRSH
jgi:hypothetical protein